MEEIAQGNANALMAYAKHGQAVLGGLALTLPLTAALGPAGSMSDSLTILVTALAACRIYSPLVPAIAKLIGGVNRVLVDMSFFEEARLSNKN